jgi:hypothetical protein
MHENRETGLFFLPALAQGYQRVLVTFGRQWLGIHPGFAESAEDFCSGLESAEDFCSGLKWIAAM